MQKTPAYFKQEITVQKGPGLAIHTASRQSTLTAKTTDKQHATFSTTFTDKIGLVFGINPVIRMRNQFLILLWRHYEILSHIFFRGRSSQQLVTNEQYLNLRFTPRRVRHEEEEACPFVAELLVYDALCNRAQYNQFHQN